MKMAKKFTLLVLLVLAGCSESPVDNTDAAVLGVESVGSGIMQNLVVTLNRPASVEVTYWYEDGPRLRLTTTAPELVDTIFLPRLRERTRYSYDVRIAGGSGESGSNGQFMTGELPAELSGFRFEASGRPTAPLTMIELMVTKTGASGVIIVDQTGKIVWHWRASGGFVNGATRRANGNFVFLDQDRGLVEVDPAGREIHFLPHGSEEGGTYGNIHHDVIATPQNTLYFLARETQPVAGTQVTGEAIWEWSPERNSLRKLWSAFDFLDYVTERTPASSPSNWLHANSLQIGPRGSLIVSFRNIDQVISIAPDFRSFDWRLNGPGGTLQMDDADRFYGQHSPVEVAPNRVMIFDNAIGGPGGAVSSRVIELAVDPVAKRVSRVWEFVPDPPNNALRVGSVRRHANGNTLATFGWGQGSPIAVYEVTPAGTVHWQLVSTSGIDRLYRATPLMSIGNEVEVE